MSAAILVVDDDPSLVHMLKEYLQGEGYEVIESFDGDTALKRARERRPALAIIDLNMPAMGGLRVLHSLRGSPDTSNIPAVVLTGEADRTVIQRLQGMARVQLLQKPVELETLGALLRRLLV